VDDNHDLVQMLELAVRAPRLARALRREQHLDGSVDRDHIAIRGITSQIVRGKNPHRSSAFGLNQRGLMPSTGGRVTPSTAICAGWRELHSTTSVEKSAAAEQQHDEDDDEQSRCVHSSASYCSRVILHPTQYAPHADEPVCS
jgi:hypothetical protein